MNNLRLTAKTREGAVTLVSFLCPGLAGRGQEVTVQRVEELVSKPSGFVVQCAGWTVTIANRICMPYQEDAEKLSITAFVRELA